MVIAVLLAVPLGVVAAWQAGTQIDRLVMLVAGLGFSVPIFWRRFLLIYIFAVQLEVLPMQGYVGTSTPWSCV